MFILKPSFTAGELSPALYGRTDLAKYDTGAAKLKNFYVLRYGGVANRPGTKYIALTHNNTPAVLIPFRYNANENYIVELTAGKIRIIYKNTVLHNDEGQEIILSTPYLEEEIKNVKYTQSADVVFMVHPKHYPMTLTRYSHNDWRFTKMEITGGPYDDYNTGGITLACSNRIGGISLNASNNLFNKNMEGSLVKIEHQLNGVYKKGVPSGGETISVKDERIVEGQEVTLTRPPKEARLVDIKVYNLYGKPIKDFTYNEEANTIFIQNIPSYPNLEYCDVIRDYVVNDLDVECAPGGTVYVESFGFWNGDFSLEKLVDNQWVKIRTQEGNRSQNYNFTEVNKEDHIVSYRISSTKFDTTTWSGENQKQRGYVSIQSFSNVYYGEVIITEVLNPQVALAVVIRKIGSLQPTKSYAISAWNNAKGYPACACFYADRLVFAGSPSAPQTFWMSKTGDYFNFSTSFPGQDNDAITATLNGGQMNGIKAMVAFGELIMLTAGGEYKVHGDGKALTGTNIMSQAQEYRGISDILPVTVGSRIIYLQHQGNIIRDLAYVYEADKYTGDDLNLLAEHLFGGHKIISVTYQQTPNSIVWCVRDDGVLLGLTYLKEQDVWAWHQHTTRGKFINVCSIAGEKEDELYCVVQRGDKYFVEVFEDRDQSTDPSEQYFVDCGITIHPGSRSINNLDHLEGQEVAILADGNVLPRQTVANGCVDVDMDYKTIHIGLPYTAELKTLPIEFEGQDGTYLSRKKRIAKITLMFKDSRGGTYGIDHLDEIKWKRTTWGQPLKLFTGKKAVVVPRATWDDTQQLTVRQEDPLPITILSMVPEVEAGG